MTYQLMIGDDIKITRDDIIKRIIFSIEQKDKTSSEHSSNLFNSICVYGKINDNSQEDTLNLLNWSLKTDKGDIYKTVKIKIFDNNDKIREYFLENVFCASYRETFDNTSSSDGNNNSKIEEGVFELILKQRFGLEYLKTIQVDCK